MPHELGMDIVLLGADMSDPLKERFTVVQSGVYEDRRDGGETHKVDHGVGRGEVQRRVASVGFLVKGYAVDHLAHIVFVTVPVERAARRDRKVGKVPRLCTHQRETSYKSADEPHGEEELQTNATHVLEVNDGCDDPVKEEESERDIALGPPRGDERRADIDDLRPVERKDTHAETRDRSKQSIDRRTICWGTRGERNRRTIISNLLDGRKLPKHVVDHIPGKIQQTQFMYERAWKRNPGMK